MPPIKLLDLGADEILKRAFRNHAPADRTWDLRLFVNDVTLADTDTTDTYTEAAGGGYAAINLVTGNWTLTVADDPSRVVYNEVTFTFTGALNNNASVYGYYITDRDSPMKAWFSERLGTSFTPANNGDQLKITPSFSLSKGVPV